jgi:hypothetical protein
MEKELYFNYSATLRIFSKLGVGFNEIKYTLGFERIKGCLHQAAFFIAYNNSKGRRHKLLKYSPDYVAK